MNRAEPACCGAMRSKARGLGGVSNVNVVLFALLTCDGRNYVNALREEFTNRARFLRPCRSAMERATQLVYQV